MGFEAPFARDVPLRRAFFTPEIKTGRLVSARFVSLLVLSERRA